MKKHLIITCALSLILLFLCSTVTIFFWSCILILSVNLTVFSTERLIKELKK